MSDMQLNSFFLILSFALLAGPSPSHAAKTKAVTPSPLAKTASVKDTLQQAAIHAKYRDGSFETVIEILEAFLKTHKSFRREDSLFLAKHLAVVYCSNPALREKGRYYMRRLLELNPSAQLLDMYVGDDIDKVWDKVRAEFFASQSVPPIENAPALSLDATAAAAEREERREEPPARKGNPTLKVAAWTGAGLAATGLVAWFLLSGGETGGKNFTIDARTPQP
jgi:hypothetical protein